MRVIIAGSRSITDYNLLLRAIEKSGFHFNEVVSGGAIGVDRLGERFAEENGIELVQFLPDYERYGRFFAPLQRNCEMARYADALIAVWDGKSAGTRDMIHKAESRRLLVYVSK